MHILVHLDVHSAQRTYFCYLGAYPNSNFKPPVTFKGLFLVHPSSLTATMNRRSRGRSPYGTSALSHIASHTSPNSSGRAPSSPLPSDKSIFEGLDTKCIQMLTVPSLDTTDAAVDIKDVEYIGSYNWIKDPNSASDVLDPSPTIIVPGKIGSTLRQNTAHDLIHRVPTRMAEQGCSL